MVRGTLGGIFWQKGGPGPGGWVWLGLVGSGSMILVGVRFLFFIIIIFLSVISFSFPFFCFLFLFWKVEESYFEVKVKSQRAVRSEFNRLLVVTRRTGDRGVDVNVGVFVCTAGAVDRQRGV